MTTQNPQTLEELIEEFRKEFTYSDENENLYLLGGYDQKRNINTDSIPELEAFIKKVYAAGGEAERERITNGIDGIYQDIRQDHYDGEKYPMDFYDKQKIILDVKGVINITKQK